MSTDDKTKIKTGIPALDATMQGGSRERLCTIENKPKAGLPPLTKSTPNILNVLGLAPRHLHGKSADIQIDEVPPRFVREPHPDDTGEYVIYDTSTGVGAVFATRRDAGFSLAVLVEAEAKGEDIDKAWAELFDGWAKPLCSIDQLLALIAEQEARYLDGLCLTPNEFTETPAEKLEARREAASRAKALGLVYVASARLADDQGHGVEPETEVLCAMLTDEGRARLARASAPCSG